MLALCAEPGGLLLTFGLQPVVTVPLSLWSLFANVLNYLLVAALFVVEFVYRRRRFPQQPYRGLLDFTRRVASLGAMFGQAERRIATELDARPGPPGRRRTPAMRIAFISANREKLPDAVIPLGILSVMAATPAQHEKLFWDLCFEPDPLATVARNLRESQPDLVAIGLRNLQNMDYTNITANLDAYRAIIRTVRANSPAPIVLGGGGFSVMPQGLMEDLGADYGIAGEGERAFPQLLDELAKPEPALDGVDGLYYRANGIVRFAGHSGRFLALDDLPRPDRSVLPERYYTEYGIESLQTKRGCPLRCDYCTYPLIEGTAGPPARPRQGR